jgi:hypothetical protein
MEKPPGVYWSVLESGETWLLNFSDDDAVAVLEGGRRMRLAPYTIATAPK